MRTELLPFADVSSQATSAPLRSNDYREKVVQIYGTFAATVSIEGSLDAANWSAVAVSVTAPGFVSVPYALPYLRVNVTAFTSGKVQATLAGLQSRSL